MSMLTQRDIDTMEQDVRDIIFGWQLKINIVKPLPASEQPNWNPLLGEYSGDIAYTLYENVVAERKDIQDKNTWDLNEVLGAGNKDDGKLAFALSNYYDWVDLTCTVHYENLEWRVAMIKQRIGEILILVSKNTGSTMKLANEPTAIIDCSEMSGGQ